MHLHDIYLHHEGNILELIIYAEPEKKHCVYLPGNYAYSGCMDLGTVEFIFGFFPTGPWKTTGGLEQDKKNNEASKRCFMLPDLDKF